MKKSILVIIALIAIVLFQNACNKKEESVLKSTDKRIAPKEKKMETMSYSVNFIPIDSANKMINSYLLSIETGVTPLVPDLHSLILNADAIRAYLSNTDISNVKIMFAHTLDYINNSNNGVHCGYESGALTVIIAGYDEDGDYVYYDTDNVLNKSNPCPIQCPSIGTASNDILTEP